MDQDAELHRKVDVALKANHRFLEACRQYLETVRPAISAISDNIQVDSVSSKLIYRCMAKRAEESLRLIIATAHTSHSFAGPLALRPLCEDLIYGCWLRSFPSRDADGIVKLSAMDDMLKSLRAQTKFLPRAYDKYTLLPIEEIDRLIGPEAIRSEEFVRAQIEVIDAERTRFRDDIRTLGSGLGWVKVPSIRSMAEQCQLEEIYEFFYHGTSKAVHSDLHRMTQMVGRSAGGNLSISSQNMSEYYSIFSLAYGMWLTEELLSRVISPEFPEEYSLIDDQAHGAWLAMVLTGLSRNRALPPLVTPLEEMSFLPVIEGR
jgi:Family of unknown function (DUF5677)